MESQTTTECLCTITATAASTNIINHNKIPTQSETATQYPNTEIAIGLQLLQKKLKLQVTKGILLLWKKTPYFKTQ